MTPNILAFMNMSPRDRLLILMEQRKAGTHPAITAHSDLTECASILKEIETMKSPDKTVNRRKPVGGVSPADVADIVKSASARKEAAKRPVASAPAESTAKAGTRTTAARKPGKPAKKPKAVRADGKRQTKLQELEAMLMVCPVPLKSICAQFDWKPHSARAAITRVNQAREAAGHPGVVTAENEKLGRVYSLSPRPPNG